MFLFLFILFFFLCSFMPSAQTLGSYHDADQGASNDKSRETEKNYSNRDDEDVRLIEQGWPIRREIAGGQSQSYRVPASAAQFLHAVVRQDGIDVKVRLTGPNSKVLIEVDTEYSKQGEENVTWVAEEGGEYRLAVMAKGQKVPAGRYEIRLLERRPATEDERALDEARRLMREFYTLFQAGKYDEAQPIIERSLAIREKRLGPEHRDVAISLFNLASLNSRLGNYEQAEPIFRRALAILEREPEKPLLAFLLENLATLHAEKGDFAQAEALYRRALGILEKALGPEHSDVGISLNSLATIYLRRGDNEKAEPLLRRALAIMEKAFEPENRMIALPLNNLALIYKGRGDYERAEPLYQRSLAIKEKALGPDHFEVSISLNNLANLYQNMGDYARAEPLLERAIAIVQRVRPDNPYLGRYLTNLATIYTLRDDYAKAEPLFERALAIKEKVLGPENPDLGPTLDNLGFLNYKRGDYAKAEALYLRALAVLEKSLRPDHPTIASVLSDLAEVSAAKGDFRQVSSYLSRAIAVDERNLALNLASGSEREKLAYLSLFSDRTDFTIWFQSQAVPADPEALDLAFTTLLRRKARGLDAMTDTIANLRRHATPEDKILFDKLSEARSQLPALIFDESNSAKSAGEEIKGLAGEVENLEEKLSARSAEFRVETQPVTIAAVQATLPVAGALVEYALYTPQEPRTGKSLPQRYIAYLLTARGRPGWVDLGEAAPIDRAVDKWRQALRGNRVDAKRLAREVDELVMRPVRSSLQTGPGEIRQLLIAPDGALNLIPFAAMVNEDNHYLIERYTISYLTCGRDLLRLQNTPPSRSAPLVVADPIFGRVAYANVRGAQRFVSSSMRSHGKNEPGQMIFRPLPGTKGEALAIKALLPEASVLLQGAATEEALKQVRAPRILHIATHGFFRGDQSTANEGKESLRLSGPQLSRRIAQIEEPLLRSGLALAGANRGKDGDNDGVLTALEVAGLDLWGTKLVVLSACDTGLGELRKDEGVQGLRRALVLAGSESQVMSLWPVTDEGAREFMTEYYKALQRGEGRGEGLRQVQLRMLHSKERRHPFYWAAFIQSGEWANLAGKR
ncbi:MAG: tetratricopeptide repeat protein [Blastocatellia bacterium]|nr:tetratricopeptide repeat protein [Blastocatellia bacterium]